MVGIISSEKGMVKGDRLGRRGWGIGIICTIRKFVILSNGLCTHKSYGELKKYSSHLHKTQKTHPPRARSLY